MPKKPDTTEIYVTPQMFGAKPVDGFDNIEALEEALRYCMDNMVKFYLPSGRYGISRQFVIGDKFIHERDINYYNLSDAPSWNSDIIRTDNFCVEFEGGKGAEIYTTFSSAESTAVIYVGLMKHWVKGTDFGISIKNIKITGGENQVGLMPVHSLHSRFENISVNNCTSGIIAHSCYYSQFNNIQYNNCNEGWKDIGCNGTNYNNFHAESCKIGFIFQSNTNVINNLTEEQCETAIWFNGSSQIVANSLYLESNIKQTTEPLVRFTNCDMIEINGSLMASAGLASIGRYQDCFYFNEQCKRVSISNTNIFGNVVTKCDPKEVVYRNFVHREGAESF